MIKKVLAIVVFLFISTSIFATEMHDFSQLVSNQYGNYFIDYDIEWDDNTISISTHSSMIFNRNMNPDYVKKSDYPSEEEYLKDIFSLARIVRPNEYIVIPFESNTKTYIITEDFIRQINVSTKICLKYQTEYLQLMFDKDVHEKIRLEMNHEYNNIVNAFNRQFLISISDLPSVYRNSQIIKSDDYELYIKVGNDIQYFKKLKNGKVKQCVPPLKK